MRKKLITKYPEKKPKISPPADSCAKTQSGNEMVPKSKYLIFEK